MKIKRLIFVLILVFGFALYAQSGVTGEGDKEKKKPKAQTDQKQEKQQAKTEQKKETQQAKTAQNVEIFTKKVVSPYVKAAQARKESTKKSVIVITNTTLKDWKSSDRLNVMKEDGDKTKDVTLDPYTDETGRGEKYWKHRIQTATQKVLDLEKRVDDLQSRINRLQTDFYNWDDPHYRDTVIKPALDKALQDFETAKKQLEAAREDLEGIDEEARKAGALPGWLR